MRNTLLSLILVSWLGTPLPAQDNDRTEPSESDALFSYLTGRLTTYSWSTPGSESTSFELKTDPLLRYTDPVREFLGGGQLHLILDGKRPVAACSIWLHRQREATIREFATLADEGLICRNADGDVVWQPQPAEVLFVPLKDARDPASAAPRRLSQMRAAARRFSATFFRRLDGDAAELRLLPQPVYRFSDAADGITDGAVFAFVQSTDPDLLLMIAARTDPDSGEPVWTYSVARMNSGHVVVRLDDAAIREYADYYQNPRTNEDQYIEAEDTKYPAP